MKKLSLNLDELKVESFETNLLKRNNGTVNGQAITDDPNYCEPSDKPNDTCGVTFCGYLTCNYSCRLTCDHTCGDNETCMYPDSPYGCA